MAREILGGQLMIMFLYMYECLKALNAEREASIAVTIGAS